MAMLCGVGCALSKDGLGARLWRLQVPLYLPRRLLHSFHLAFDFCSPSFRPFPLNSPQAMSSAGMDTPPKLS